MSRGFGQMQRLILRVMEAAMRYEPQGPHEPHLYFHDAQGTEYHPAQVVRLGWLTQVIALDAHGFWERPGGVLAPSFKASFSRAMRRLYGQRVLLSVWKPSLLTLRQAAEYPGKPQAVYRRRASDRYIVRNPAVSVNSFWVNT
jgi:hypothetical protein